MLLKSCANTEHLANDLACPNMVPRSRAAMQQRAETLDDAQIREFSNCVLREHISARSVAVPRRRNSAMMGARSMELLLRQQNSTGVLETNSPPLMPALPLLLLPHILPWHILFLAQSNRALKRRITATSVNVPRRRRSAMVRSRSMRLLLRQPKYTDVLEKNLPPLMPAMPLLFSPHILLQQY